MNYLISHYKGKYRIRCEYDLQTKQFPRKLDGAYEDIDCYIDCYHGVRILSYGHGTLIAYIPSLIRGHNIVKAIKEEFGGGVIFNAEETDSEVLFRFKGANMDKLEKYLKPKTSGSGISPFSARNLPKSEYNIPDGDLEAYKKIASILPKNKLILLSHITKDYLKSICNKNWTYDDIKADMALKGIKGKSYIHSIGKWESYMKYLKDKILNKSE